MDAISQLRKELNFLNKIMRTYEAQAAKQVMPQNVCNIYTSLAAMYIHSKACGIP
jgi:hypothetical protein